MDETQKKPSGAPKGNKNAVIHGIDSLVRPRRKPGRKLKPIDRRFREGKQATRFKAELISDAGGLENMSATKKAAMEIIVAKFNRLLRAYRWQFRSPPPPIVNARKKTVYPIVKDLDAMENSFINAAKEFGFERVAKTLTLEELLAADDAADGTDDNATGRPGE